MQIYVLDECPVKAAQMQYTKHIRNAKLATEAIQMLTMCFPPEFLVNLPRTIQNTVRKVPKRHYNHPCSVWVRQSTGNVDWLIAHAKAIFDERRRRGFRKPAFGESVILGFERVKEHVNVPKGERTQFVRGFKSSIAETLTGFDELSIIDQYRQYYAIDKAYLK